MIPHGVRDATSSSSSPQQQSAHDLLRVVRQTIKEGRARPVFATDAHTRALERYLLLGMLSPPPMSALEVMVRGGGGEEAMAPPASSVVTVQVLATQEDQMWEAFERASPEERARVLCVQSRPWVHKLLLDMHATATQVGG